MPTRYSEIDESSYDAEELLNPRAVRHDIVNTTPEQIPAVQGTQYEAGRLQSAEYEPRREAPAQPTQEYREPAAPQPAPRPESDASHYAGQAAYTPPVNAPAPQPTQSREDRYSENLIGHSTLQKLRMFSGIILFFLAAYTLIVTISYFASLSHDQSALLGADYDPYLYGNAGGVIGAWVSHFLLYEWLGVGGFIFIYYVGAISLKLLNVIRFRFWNFTFKCMLSAVAVSVIGGFLVEVFGAHTRFYWGGLHGYMINHQLTLYAGIWGALGVSDIIAG
ncbi:MAG: DNA translocase FtsK 4TM domain-containing protein, partial [Duncaniella sp.]|nr:DNA translocase FtsK 4TM domain-containing protein [Duncaniella sp.]